MPELYDQPIIPVRTHRDIFETLEDEIFDIPEGQTIINPRIIGGEIDTTKVTFTFYEHTVAAGTGKGVPATIIVDRACTIDKVYIHVETAPGGVAVITVDVNKNGTTIFTTQGNRPSITGTATEDESGAPDVNNLIKDDKLTMDIDVNSGAAAYLSVYVRCK